jgi:hydrogenase maturation protease
MKKRILIAGIGNIFFGDDAFGVEAARELSGRPLPEEVEVRDFGIRAYDLAYALTGDYETVILVDALSRGEAPGTVTLIEPEIAELDRLDPGEPDAHAMNPMSVLRLARTLGGIKCKLYLAGCEPAVLEDETGAMGLSAPVQAAVPETAAMIESLVFELLNSQGEERAGLAPA